MKPHAVAGPALRYALRMENFDTARLHVRPLGEGDAALYCRLYADPGVMRYIAAPLTGEAARRSFGVALRQQARHPQRWILSERRGGECVGLVALVGEGDGPEIGVMVVPERHGLGYGHESMSGLVRSAFEGSALTVITARQSVPDNPIVVRMMRSLGFDALPPTPERPAGGEWELRRGRWEARCRGVPPVAAARTSG